MSFLIVANSLILGLQVQVLAQDAAKHAAQMRELPESAFDVFFAMHWLFCIAFSIDLTLRWWADGFWDFFQGVDAGWNIFDIFVVAFAIVDVIVDTAFLSSGSPTSVLNSRRSFTTLRVLRVVRIIRVLRVVRMLTFFRELRMMIHSTIGCFKSVFFVMVLFGALLYIFGIAFTSAFIDHMAELSMWQDTKYADLIEFFGTVTLSGLSLSGNVWWPRLACVLPSIGNHGGSGSFPHTLTEIRVRESHARSTFWNDSSSLQRAEGSEQSERLSILPWRTVPGN